MARARAPARRLLRGALAKVRTAGVRPGRAPRAFRCLAGRPTPQALCSHTACVRYALGPRGVAPRRCADPTAPCNWTKRRAFLPPQSAARRMRAHLLRDITRVGSCRWSPRSVNLSGGRARRAAGCHRAPPAWSSKPEPCTRVPLCRLLCAAPAGPTMLLPPNPNFAITRTPHPHPTRALCSRRTA